MFGYLEDKLKIQTADFTLDNAIDKLNEIGVDKELVEKVKKISEKCEFARFSPAAVGNDAQGEIYKSVESIINEIESAIKIKK